MTLEIRDRFVDRPGIADAAILATGRLELVEDHACGVVLVQKPHPPAGKTSFGVAVEQRGGGRELLDEMPEVHNLRDVRDDNWTFLSEELPEGEEALDFFHASEHLHAACAAAYGDSTRETRHRFEELRDTLRDEHDGVARVIRALDHLRKRFPQRKTLHQCAAYFRKHRQRMNYASLVERGLPIGSGVVEAACKTLVAQRLKLSGMRWGRGAQAILTTRGWDQSERFDEAWALLVAKYQVEVHVLANIIPFAPPKPVKPKRSRRANSAG